MPSAHRQPAPRPVVRGALLALSLAAVVACGRPAQNPSGSSVAAILGGEAQAGFPRALEPRPFVFPADHGPHPDFRNEWWYFTGHLEGDEGHRYGYQLTFFRNRLVPAGTAPPRPSAWATEQAYLAHFAVTDAAGGTFRSFERWNRGALGLAGAVGEPALRVWLGDWQLTGDDTGTFQIVARGEDRALSLRLEPTRPAILQGDRGLSRKGEQAGNASYYYSLPRLESRGELEIDGRRVAVRGQSWLDREWSTSVLEAGQTGWDWFSVSLSNGLDLMYYRLRRDDGRRDRNSSGSLSRRDGETRSLDSGAVTLRPLRSWTSPESGARYPVAWQLDLAEEDLRLTLEPLLEGQELAHSFRYWEGAMTVRGSVGGQPVTGTAYVELTGYDR